jgi:hypothetical protein
VFWQSPVVLTPRKPLSPPGRREAVRYLLGHLQQPFIRTGVAVLLKLLDRGIAVLHEVEPPFRLDSSYLFDGHGFWGGWKGRCALSCRCGILQQLP